MDKPEITPATPEEREWAANLLFNTDPWVTLGIPLERCRMNCNNPDFQVYIPHIESKPCGVLILDKRGVLGCPYIKSIAIAKEFRSMKIGDSLMEFAENLYRGESKYMFLCVSSFNTRARAFYERRGYNAVGEIKDFVVEGKSEILMHKRI
jgi:[ribosomal protein S18]-alanine N-acetyltransferase